MNGLEQYPLFARDKLRYADTDRQGHVNNAVFATFLETGRTELVFQLELAEEAASFVIARLELDFIQEITWPGEVEIGTAVLETGRSSLKLLQTIFQNGKPVAKAVSVVVQVSNETRKSHPLSHKAQDLLKKYLRPASET
ncbi:acyl-CoA thioesterase [Rhodobacterales bacterium]|nr:acyl-CoA thioesterase [Rhodobacterales bacterium]